MGEGRQEATVIYGEKGLKTEKKMALCFMFLGCGKEFLMVTTDKNHFI